MVKFEVIGHTPEIEVDTGAAVPGSAVAVLQPTAQLQHKNVVLKTYTGELILVKGILSVDICYGQQCHKD